MRKKVAYMIARLNPTQKAHVEVALWLLSWCDEIIVAIGSCYEVGSPRHPLLAFLREKMFALSLVHSGIDISRVRFVHIRDFVNDFNGWWKHAMSIPGIEDVTYFVTGNEEQIINELNKRNIDIPFELINPEKDMPRINYFPYHATDLRDAVNNNNYELFSIIAASGTIALMGNAGGFSGIKDALNNVAPKFIPGRQTVDMIVTCRSKKGKPMLLCGYRSQSKENFPGWLAIPGGGINEYENPMDAAIREFKEETGLDVKFANKYLEPAHVLVNGIIAEMKFIGLFGTNNKKLSGNQGGSSQVFHINLTADWKQFNGAIKSKSDLEKVRFRLASQALQKGLAYQQTAMVQKALAML